MLPVLFIVVVPAGWAKPGAALVALLLVLGRAWSLRRGASGDAEPPSWGEALWDDKVVVVALAAAVGLLWKAGILDGEMRLPLHTYGLAMALGFLAAIALAQREARRVGQDPERLGDLAFWVLVSALVGSRLYFIVVNWRDYLGGGWLEETRLGRVPRLLAFWEGGLVFYGGFLAAAAAAFLYLRRARLPFLGYADTIIPSVAVGHFFGRLGCFAAGCCFGEPSSSPLPWLVRFPPDSAAYQSLAARSDSAAFLAADRSATVPIHPTQLYEALGELVIFAALTLVVRRHQRFRGQVLAAWLVLYALLRAGVEVFRGDVERGLVAGRGVGQWTSLAIFAAGVAVWSLGRRAVARAGAPAAAVS